MGKTIFAAVVAAVLASVATVLILQSFQAEQRAADAAERKLAADTVKVEQERIERRLAEVEKRAAAAPRTPRRSDEPSTASTTETAPGAAPPGGGILGTVAPDGTPYVSRAELEAEIKKAHLTGLVNGTTADAWKPTPMKSLEEIARDMGLSAGEEANLRNVLRANEEDLVRSLFGDRPLDEVKRDVLAAKEDPEKKAELIQTMAMNVIPNIGKLATLKDREKKQVTNVLGPDRAAKFLAQPRMPALGPEFEEFLK